MANWSVTRVIQASTFITTFGRFCLDRPPFRITSAPEHFQKRTSQVLEGSEGSLYQMDILVYGKSVEEHNEHLEATLHKLQEANFTLNEEKCEFSKLSVVFVGSVMNSEVVPHKLTGHSCTTQVYVF